MKKFSLTLHPILPYLFSFLLIFVVNSLERIIYITSSYSFLKTTNIWQLPHTPSSPLPTGTTSCQDNQQLLVFKSNGPFYINYWTSLLTI